MAPANYDRSMMMAMVAVDVARCECDFLVPGDIAVIGFDEIAAAGDPAYVPTTIRQPIAMSAPNPPGG